MKKPIFPELDLGKLVEALAERVSQRILERLPRATDGNDPRPRAAGSKPDLDPFLVEADGTRLEYSQYPGQLSPPSLRDTPTRMAP